MEYYSGIKMMKFNSKWGTCLAPGQTGKSWHPKGALSTNISESEGRARSKPHAPQMWPKKEKYEKTEFKSIY